MIGTGAAIALALLGGASAGAQVYATKKSGDINEKSLEAQRQSDANALQLERERMAQDKQLAEERMALYKQANAPYWAAGQNLFGSLLGMARTAGANVSGVPAPSSAPAGGHGPTPSGIDWTAAPEALAGQLNGYFSNAGYPTTETPYWVSKAGDLVARGKELGNPNYPNERLMAADIFGGAPAASPSPTGISTPSAAPQSLYSLAQGVPSGISSRPSSVATTLASKYVARAVPQPLQTAIIPGMSMLDLARLGLTQNTVPAGAGTPL